MTARVYLAYAASHGHKVGHSKDPRGRVKTIAREIEEPVTLLFESEPLEDAEAAELLAHWILREHHQRAEWFNVSEALAMAAISDAIERAAGGERAPQRINGAHKFGERKTFRLSVDLPDELVAAVDDYRATHQVWSRGEAIRRMVKEMLASPAR